MHIILHISRYMELKSPVGKFKDGVAVSGYTVMDLEKIKQD